MIPESGMRQCPPLARCALTGPPITKIYSVSHACDEQFLIVCKLVGMK